MSLTAKRVGDNIQLHDDDLGIHMFTATKNYGRAFNVKHTKEAEKHFPGIGSHPEMKYDKYLRDVNIGDIAGKVSHDHNRILRAGGKPRYNYEHAGIESTEKGYGDVTVYNHAHNIIERKTGRLIGKVVSKDNTQEPMKYPSSEAKLTLNDEFTNGVNMAALKTKATPYMKNPAENMHHIVNIADSIRGKQPSFIGTVQTTGHKEFQTHLSPEEASSKYEGIMRSKSELKNFVRHTPTHFEYNDGYNDGQAHTILSTPGKLVHKEHSISSYSMRKNTELYEAALMERLLKDFPI